MPKRPSLPSRPVTRVQLLLAVFVAGLWGAAPTTGETASPTEVAPPRATGAAPRLDPGQGPDGVAYVDEAVCGECHAAERSAWLPSHHALAMQRATPDSVLGDFGNVVHEQDGSVIRFSRRGERFLVEAEGRDGVRREHEIVYTFGVEPLQQYLVAADGGRLQTLAAAWDTSKKAWFDVDPAQSPRPGDPFHWTGRYQSWNAMCADCHSTNLRRGYDSESDTYETRWSVLNVGCQACHGPGARHVAWARAPAEGRVADRGLTPTHTMTSSQAEVETCAPCHARRSSINGDRPLHGSLLDDYAPQVLAEGLYHPDGQILDEVYVYGSFVQSRMYAAGVRCSDCHEPHGLGLRAEGNALCTRCHAAEPEPDRVFTGLRPGVYDAPSHHHHEVGSDGAQCVACHMPSRTYMVVDPRRDHGLRVPRPDLSVSLGVPNACNGCHDDQSAAWAAQQVRDWFGPERRYGSDFAAALHDGRLGAAGASPDLIALTRPGAAPDIVRATAVSLLPRVGVASLAPLEDALADRDPLVRLRAAIAAATLPASERLRLLRPLLGDDVRGVRAEAGRALADVPDSLLTADERKLRGRAVDEYARGQRASADLPAGRINLALLHTAQGRLAEAEHEYRTAISQDPLFVPPVANLTQLLSASGRGEEAEVVLREGLDRLPEEGELHYSLGLLLAESGRLDEAIPALERASRLMPGRSRVHYNLGLALQHLGRRSAAAKALERAAAAGPDEPDYARALAILYLQSGRYGEARDQARRWSALAPQDRDARAVLSHAERGLSGAGAGAR